MDVPGPNDIVEESVGNCRPQVWRFGLGFLIVVASQFVEAADDTMTNYVVVTEREGLDPFRQSAGLVHDNEIHYGVHHRRSETLRGHDGNDDRGKLLKPDHVAHVLI